MERRCKARLVASGFEKRGKDMNTDAPTCALETLRMGWNIQSLDIKTAYLQGDEIKKTVYLRLPIEAREGGCQWRLKKMVYGLKNAARAWYESATRVIEKIGGARSKIDPALYYWKKEGQLIQIMCSHVDDFFYGGMKTLLEEVIGQLTATLEVGVQKQQNFST